MDGHIITLSINSTISHSLKNEWYIWILMDFSRTPQTINKWIHLETENQKTLNTTKPHTHTHTPFDPFVDFEKISKRVCLKRYDFAMFSMGIRNLSLTTTSSSCQRNLVFFSCSLKRHSPNSVLLSDTTTGPSFNPLVFQVLPLSLISYVFFTIMLHNVISCLIIWWI